MSLSPPPADGQAPRYSAKEVIEILQLDAHVEGGYYRRTFESSSQPAIDTKDGERLLMTSIYYLLTANASVGHFHRNKSDIVHYFHMGDAVSYYLIHPDGSLQTLTMGVDLRAGQRLQMTVPGGVWKASMLNADGCHGYGLVSEAVSPGFDYADMTLGDRAKLAAMFPRHAELIQELSRTTTPPAA